MFDRKTNSLALAVLAGTLGFSSVGSALDAQCDMVGQVSGTIRSTNLNENLQRGMIRLVVTVDGVDFYRDTGVFIGQVSGYDSTTGLPLLHHKIFFEDNTEMQTTDDAILAMYPTGKLENGVPCEFAVTEVISSAWGNRALIPMSNDNHEIFAVGTISYCSEEPRNMLELSGDVCIN